MKTVTIHDAKTNLSKYIASAKKGQNIYIGGFGKAEVVLTKISADKVYAMRKHNFSIGKNKIVEKSDSFSTSIDQKVAKLLYGD